MFKKSGANSNFCLFGVSSKVSITSITVKQSATYIQITAYLILRYVTASGNNHAFIAETLKGYQLFDFTYQQSQFLSFSK